MKEKELDKTNLVPILFDYVSVYYDTNREKYITIIQINGKDYYGELEECE